MHKDTFTVNLWKPLYKSELSIYYSYRDYMIKEYGEALYSITVDLDLGCPNRDENGNGGCSFCPTHGARSAQSMDANSVEEQIKVGIAFAKKDTKQKDLCSISKLIQEHLQLFQNKKRLIQNF